MARHFLFCMVTKYHRMYIQRNTSPFSLKPTIYNCQTSRYYTTGNISLAAAIVECLYSKAKKTPKYRRVLSSITHSMLLQPVTLFFSKVQGLFVKRKKVRNWMPPLIYSSISVIPSLFTSLTVNLGRLTMNRVLSSSKHLRSNSFASSTSMSG